MKILLVLFFIGFLLMGCNSISTALTPTEPVRVATATGMLEQNLVPFPTNIQLPGNPDTSSDANCKPPSPVLPVEDGNDISEDEIVYELLETWLRRYRQPAIPDFCRIEDYSVEKVYDDPGIYSKVLEPRGDFKRVVVFSVKLARIPSDWMSFPGELDQENWLHINHIVAVTNTSEGYMLEFAYP